MQLTERHIIKKSNKDWEQIDKMCFISKNLYNQAIYYIKQNYRKTGKFLRFYDVEKYFRTNDLGENENYKLLNNNVSQQILMLLDRNIKSFFQLLKKWKKDKKSLSGCPKFPKYKDKIKGRNLLIFPYTQFSVKDNYIYFPKKMSINPIFTKICKNQKRLDKVHTIQQIRIVPQSFCYILEVIYNFEGVDYELNKNNYLSIDLGVNNLCACVTNQSGLKPLLINGRPLKSINQYANKLIAKEQNQLKKNHNKDSSNKTNRIWLKRQNKISYYLHNVSKYIIQYCIDNDIGNIVIGKNKEWKQKVNIGKKNNQSFTQIPFNILIQQLFYKSQMVGINVIEQEESYTSKVDHLAFEKMKHQENYLGKRIKRGLFKSSTGQILNADINGAIGILRKVIGDDFINQLNRGYGYCPLKVLPL